MVAVTETTDSVGPFSANLVAGKLDIEVPSSSHFCTIQIIPLLQDLWMTDLRMFWLNGVHEMLILCSDAAACMLKAATALKLFYPNLVHFTCLAHGLQSVAEEVRSQLPKVNKLI
jgi:hypothetical protein